MQSASFPQAPTEETLTDVSGLLELVLTEEIPNHQAEEKKQRKRTHRCAHTRKEHFSVHAHTQYDDERKGKWNVGVMCHIVLCQNNKKQARTKGEGFNWHTGYNKAWAWVMGKGLATTQDVTRHVSVCWGRVWLAHGMTPGQSLRQPGRAESPAVTSVSPFSGGNCQSAASHIAPSLTLIAIVNPRGPEDANASAVALLEG